MLLQLLDVQEQQLDVEQLEQLDVLVLLLHASVIDTSRSAMSSISNVSLASARSSFASSLTVPPPPRLTDGSLLTSLVGFRVGRCRVVVREAHGHGRAVWPVTLEAGGAGF